MNAVDVDPPKVLVTSGSTAAHESRLQKYSKCGCRVCLWLTLHLLLRFRRRQHRQPELKYISTVVYRLIRVILSLWFTILLS